MYSRAQTAERLQSESMQTISQYVCMEDEPMRFVYIYFYSDAYYLERNCSNPKSDHPTAPTLFGVCDQERVDHVEAKYSSAPILRRTSDSSPVSKHAGVRKTTGAFEIRYIFSRDRLENIRNKLTHTNTRIQVRSDHRKP